MIVPRLIGWILLCLGAALLAYDIATWMDTSKLSWTLTGRIWRDIDPNSLLQLQPAVERHLHPSLWRYGLQPVLQTPAFIVFGVLGIVLSVLFRKRLPTKEEQD